jgi:hypothetical protein
MGKISGSFPLLTEGQDSPEKPVASGIRSVPPLVYQYYDRNDSDYSIQGDFPPSTRIEI